MILEFKKSISVCVSCGLPFAVIAVSKTDNIVSIDTKKNGVPISITTIKTGHLNDAKRDDCLPPIARPALSTMSLFFHESKKTIKNINKAIQKTKIMIVAKPEFQSKL
jgi:hypothetical protein